MIKTFKTRLAAFASGLLIAGVALAADDGAPMQHAGVDLSDKASLQRGAKLFVNYCSGCHSLRFLRYSRMASDLDLTEEQVMANLNFTGAKFGDHMLASMPAVHAETWFGKPPPDLSLVVRSKPGGPDWVYTFGTTSSSPTFPCPTRYGKCRARWARCTATRTPPARAK